MGGQFGNAKNIWKSLAAVALSLCLDAYSGVRAESAGVPGPFLHESDIGWKVNDFAVARWKTLIGGNEGGQIEQGDVQFGLWELAPHAIYHSHRHDVPEIYYVVSGKGEWSVGPETREVGPGDAVYTAPGSTHKMVNTTDQPLQTVWFWWAPDGRRKVFEGAYEFTEEAPEQPGNVAPWGP